MSGKSVALPVSNIAPTAPRRQRRSLAPFWILGLVVLAGLAVMLSKVMAARGSSSSNVLTPGLRLAAGTLSLEGTGQAVDAAQAAKLLPLWQLLAQLNSSSSAAPEEITTVIEEIQLNMTPEQLSAIDAMSTGASTGASAGTPAAASTKTTSSAPAGAPMLGGVGGPPLDGGGPMPSGSSQSASSSKTSASTAGPIQQVIQLLKGKVPG